MMEKDEEESDFQYQRMETLLIVLVIANLILENREPREHYTIVFLAAAGRCQIQMCSIPGRDRSKRVFWYYCPSS
jgi:hypothetical protein